MEVQWTENRRDDRKLESNFENNFKIFDDQKNFGENLFIDYLIEGLEKNNFFYNLIEKKAAKLIIVYQNNFKEMNLKNLIINMINFNLFFLILFSKFLHSF